MKKKISGRGGKRAGSGRKKRSDPIATYSINITIEQAKVLKDWGNGDMSAGMRWLIEASILFVRPSNKARVVSSNTFNVESK